jgi:hypothetical protein
MIFEIKQSNQSSEIIGENTISAPTSADHLGGVYPNPSMYWKD